MDDRRKIVTKKIWELVQKGSQIASHIINRLHGIDSNKSNK